MPRITTSPVERLIKLTGREGQRAAILDAAVEAARILGTCPGLDVYVIGISPADDHAIWVTEVWRSREDLDRSIDHSGVKENAATIGALLAGPPNITELDPVGGRFARP